MRRIRWIFFECFELLLPFSCIHSFMHDWVGRKAHFSHQSWKQEQKALLDALPVKEFHAIKVLCHGTSFTASESSVLQRFFWSTWSFSTPGSLVVTFLKSLSKFAGSNIGVPHGSILILFFPCPAMSLAHRWKSWQIEKSPWRPQLEAARWECEDTCEVRVKHVHLGCFCQDHIFEGLLGGLPYAVSVRAHNLEANVAQNMSDCFCSCFMRMEAVPTIHLCNWT